jgi:hypothetical protein
MMETKTKGTAQAGAISPRRRPLGVSILAVLYIFGTAIGIEIEVILWGAGFARLPSDLALDITAWLPVALFAILTGCLLWTGRRRGRTWGPWVYPLDVVGNVAYLGYVFLTGAQAFSEFVVTYYVAVQLVRVLLGAVVYVYLHGERATEFLTG